MGYIVNKIAVYLNRHITGNVFDKDAILDAYSSDRSALRVKPRLVALPESTSDIRKLLKFCNQLAEKKYDLPVAVRGSGLCKSGADLSSGIVISTEKMQRVRELDAHDRLIHVQAGITLGRLNSILAPHGLVLPISADPKETIGGLISNAPRDRFSHKYGGIMNYVDRIEVVLSDGDLLQTSRLSVGKLRKKQAVKSLEGNIYRQLDKTLTKHATLIEQSSQHENVGYSALRHIRRVNGKVFDMLPAFFGAEGSLGVITEVILRLEVLPPRVHRAFAVFSTLKAAQEFADYAAKLEPLAVDIYDLRIFKTVDDCGKKPDLLTKKFDDGYLILVSFNDRSGRSRRKIAKLTKFLPKSATIVSETLGNSADFDDFETSLASYLNHDSKSDRPAIYDDFYIPSDKLGKCLEGLKALEKSVKQPLPFFGSYLTSNYSIRPAFEFKKVEERRRAITLLRDLHELLRQHDGSLVGGAPEGRLKPVVVYPTLDKKQVELIHEVKDIFDPNHILAPEIKASYDTRSAVRHLRNDSSLGLTSAL